MGWGGGACLGVAGAAHCPEGRAGLQCPAPQKVRQAEEGPWASAPRSPGAQRERSDSMVAAAARCRVLRSTW